MQDNKETGSDQTTVHEGMPWRQHLQKQHMQCTVLEKVFYGLTATIQNDLNRCYQNKGVRVS